MKTDGHDNDSPCVSVKSAQFGKTDTRGDSELLRADTGTSVDACQNAVEFKVGEGCANSERK